MALARFCAATQRFVCYLSTICAHGKSFKKHLSTTCGAAHWARARLLRTKRIASPPALSLFAVSNFAQNVCVCDCLMRASQRGFHVWFVVSVHREIALQLAAFFKSLGMGNEDTLHKC